MFVPSFSYLLANKDEINNKASTQSRERSSLVSFIGGFFGVFFIGLVLFLNSLLPKRQQYNFSY